MENSNSVNDTIREILERVVRMETKLDDINSVRNKSNDALNVSTQNKISIAEMKDNIKWLWRTGLGAVIVALVVAFLKFQ